MLVYPSSRVCSGEFVTRRSFELIRYINRASSGELITLYGQRNHGVARKHFLTDLARHADYSISIIVRLNMTSSL